MCLRRPREAPLRHHGRVNQHQSADANLARVLGIRVSGGPFWQAALPIRAGLTVIYGKNGAGKSRLLDVLSAALSGRRAGLGGDYLGSDVHIDVLVGEGSVPFGPEPADSREEGTEWRSWHTYDQGNPAGPFVKELPAIYDAILQQGYWALSPLRALPEGQSEWEPRLAATPGTSQLLRALFDSEAAFSDARNASLAGDDEPARALSRIWSNRPGDAGSDSQVDWARDYGWLPTPIFSPDHGPANLVGLPSDALPVPVNGARRRPTALPVQGLRLLTESRGTRTANSMTREFVRYLRDPSSWFRTNNGWHEVEDPGLSMESLVEWTNALETIARQVYARLLLDAPDIELVLDPTPVGIASGELLRWQALGRPIEHLSQAQSRWASFAIMIALEQTVQDFGLHLDGNPDLPFEYGPGDFGGIAFPRQTFLLIDEPEAALHRAAEKHTAEGLSWLAGADGMHLVVATHSPHLLDRPDARVFRLAQSAWPSPIASWEGHAPTLPVSRIQGLGPLERGGLDDLGLEPSDLLRVTRAVLLVEGQHDLVLIPHFLSRTMAPAAWQRVLVLPLRGAKKLPGTLTPLSARLLFDYTDAHVVPILDNVDNVRLKEVWESAEIEVAALGPQEARRHLLSRLRPEPTQGTQRRSSLENEALAEWMAAALDRGLRPRVTPASLSKADIVLYLPIECFSTSRLKRRGIHSWDELIGIWQAETEEDPRGNWKPWAQRVLGLDFSDGRLLDAARSLEDVPDDFQILARECTEIVTGAGS